MKKSWFAKLVAMGIVLALICVCTGCKKPQKKPQFPGKTQSKNQPPKELTKIESELEKLYEALKPPHPAETLQKKEPQGGEQEGGKGQGEEGGQKSSQGEGGQSKQASGKQPGELDLEKIQKQVEKIHQLWNFYEPEAIKAGASPESISGFERQLNLLPNELLAMNRYGARVAVNSAALYIPDFLQLYETKSPPDLVRMRYLARDVLLKVDAGDWSKAEKSLTAMPEMWSRVRTEAKGEKETDASKVQFALTDLEHAVKARDQILVMLKEEILERNLDTMDKSLRKEMSGL